MKQDFAKLIKDNPDCLRALEIHYATMSHLRLRLALHMNNPLNRELPRRPIILCTNAVEYSIRPTNPATIEGGPAVEFHEQHELLNAPRLQMIPGGDGAIFDPPLKLGVLIFDQSYVIAEKFEIEETQLKSLPG
ncbi:MAG: hypothetical protein HOP33_06780 [Verrucomicrobia bacterium]|nr:hypothetical protein [Verrucomicrobiota bacterium]